MSKCTKCSKLDKAAIVAALQSGMSQPGAPAPQTFNGEVEGFIPPGGVAFAGANLFAHSGWDPVAFPFVTSDIIPGTANSTTCGPDIGTLVVNPNLPEGATDSFDITFEILDNTAGLGGIRLFCRTTMQPFGMQQSVPSGGLGTNTAPSTHTLTFDISAAPCPPEDIRLAYTAWGASTPDFCDSINPDIETIVVVTPSECAPALACFEALFGCSLADLVNQSGALDGCCDADDDVPVGPDYTAVTCPSVFATAATGADGEFGQKCNASVTRVSTGIYQVTFDTPHSRADYPVTFGALSSADLRDGVHVEVVNGTQNANGFQYWVGTGDNGAAADALVDKWVSWAVYDKKQFMVPRNNTEEEIKN